MTAEIAVLNRAAVSLAADSATTLISSAGMKANNNADKLFHLCHTEPVGLMLFGTAEFMGMPFEPIIKGFRNSGLSIRKASLKEYADAFFTYLETEVAIDDFSKNEHIENVFLTIVQPIVGESVKSVMSGKSNKKIPIADLVGIVVCKNIRQFLDNIKSMEDNVALLGVTHEELLATYASVARTVLLRIVSTNPPNDDIFASMVSESSVLLATFLKKDIFSDNSTGIAIAEFGSDENFPSLFVFDTEGIVKGRLKRKEIEVVNISPSGKRGHVAPLAQDDVVKRYVEGIDPRIKNRIKTKLTEMMQAFGQALAEDWTRGAKRKACKQQAELAAGQAAKEFIDGVLENSCESERQDITDVVHFMSKSELAQLAEALVEMTALRRRVSMDVETVGGPIDVAVISKGDGFVRIKRKHYFDKDLNPRYFVSQKELVSNRRKANEATR
jgi:hypothetical protein